MSLAPHGIVSPLTRLRAETRACHARLEEKLDWESICSDRDRYAALLGRFYGFYVAWEPLTATLLDDRCIEFLQSRHKKGLLRKDLGWLGWSHADIEATPRISKHYLRFENGAELLGSWYVVEGSTLGGQLLSRMIEEKLGLREGQGYSYLRSYGDRVGEAWSAFKTFLNRRIEGDSDQAEAIAGAKATFLMLENWLTSNGNG